jgi:hypothetical protein
MSFLYSCVNTKTNIYNVELFMVNVVGVWSKNGEGKGVNEGRQTWRHTGTLEAVMEVLRPPCNQDFPHFSVKLCPSENGVYMGLK